MVEIQYLFDRSQFYIDRVVLQHRSQCVICRQSTPVALAIKDLHPAPINTHFKSQPIDIRFPACLGHAETVETYIKTKLFVSDPPTGDSRKGLPQGGLFG